MSAIRIVGETTLMSANRPRSCSETTSMYANRLVCETTNNQKKTCIICGMTDGHTLINCPYKCGFCESCSKDCDCINFSLADKVMDSEASEKKNATSKRKANDDDG